MIWLWLETLKNGLVQGSLLAIMALAFAWVYHSTRFFHLAIGVPFLGGAYAAIFLASSAVIPSALVSFAAACGAGLSLLIYGLVYQPVARRNASNSLRLVASLGVYFFCSGLAAIAFGLDIKYAPTVIYDSLELGRVIVTATDIKYVATATIVIVVCACVHPRSSLGSRVLALSGNSSLFEAFGHNPSPIILAAFTLSGALAGLCGAYEGLRNGIDPNSGLAIAISASVACIVGGRSLLWGPMLGALMLGIIQAATTQIFSDRWSDSVPYACLLLLILAGPRGLLGPAHPHERP